VDALLAEAVASMLEEDGFNLTKNRVLGQEHHGAIKGCEDVDYLL
jgi:hypothetical protein